MRTKTIAIFSIVAAAAIASIAGCTGNFSRMPGASSDGPTTQSQIARITSNAVVPDKGQKVNKKTPAELWNQILSDPCPPYGSGPCPTNFEVTFAGDLLNSIPSQQPLYGHFNAFCPPGQGPSNPCPPVITYNASPPPGTTTVTFGGPGAILNQNSVHPGDVHFALMASRNQTTNIKDLEVSAEWTYDSQPPVPTPIVSVNWRQQTNGVKPNAAAPFKYAIVYLAGSNSPKGPANYGSWWAIAYQPVGRQQPRMWFENYGLDPIYVTSSGIVDNLPVPTDPSCLQAPDCPDNMKILTNLNEDGYPPPGTSGSPFKPLKYPPPSVLKPRKQP